MKPLENFAWFTSETEVKWNRVILLNISRKTPPEKPEVFLARCARDTTQRHTIFQVRVDDFIVKVHFIHKKQMPRCFFRGIEWCKTYRKPNTYRPKSSQCRTVIYRRRTKYVMYYKGGVNHQPCTPSFFFEQYKRERWRVAPESFRFLGQKSTSFFMISDSLHNTRI